MEEEIIKNNLNSFEAIKHFDENGEFWYARELMLALGYKQWRSFSLVLKKAQKSAENAGSTPEKYFALSHKVIAKGPNNQVKEEIDDYRLDRYACYLIAQNGDPARKPKIAEAQTYFAIQTRRQELADQEAYDRNRLKRRKEFTKSDKRLSNDIIESGVSVRGMAKIKNEGNKVFFGGNSSEDMKKKLKTGSRPWADRANNVVLAGKTFANELTSDSIRKRGASSVFQIEEVNNSNNEAVRETIKRQQGLYPEDYPPEEDINKVKRRLNRKDNKKLN